MEKGSRVEVVFWGMRGSYPAPGSNTVRYGGNTPCVEVQAGDSRVIIDAGTGIYPLGQQLSDRPAHHHILFSHVHWDHVQGLPFFAPLRDPAARITIYATARSLPLLQDLLTHTVRQVYLPVPLGQLKANIDFCSFRTGESFSIGSLDINSVKLNHPYFSVGFRLSSGPASAVYYSDTAPFSDILFGYEYRPRPPEPGEKLDTYEQEQLIEMRREAVALCRHTDLLIFDGHFLPSEYPRFAHFGHSTPDHALDISRDAEVKKLAIFHHAPSRTDEALDKMGDHYRPLATEHEIDLIVAQEGDRVVLKTELEIGDP